MVTSSAIIPWVPPHLRPEALEAQAKKDKRNEAMAAQTAAMRAMAEAQEKQARMMSVGRDLVLNELNKCLRMANTDDFKDAIGPVPMRDIIKLAEIVSKDHRLSTGQSTENIAHVVGPSIDFSKLSQEERDAWRALAIKGGGGG
jgi:hypothetical protein